MEALIDEILKGDFQRLGTVEVLRQFASMGIVLLLGVLAGVFFKRAVIYWIGRDGVVTSGEERVQKAVQLEVPVFLVAAALGALALFQKQGWDAYLLALCSVVSVSIVRLTHLWRADPCCRSAGFHGFHLWRDGFDFARIGQGGGRGSCSFMGVFIADTHQP